MMTPADLIEYSQSIEARHIMMIQAANEIDAAPTDEESSDHQADAYAEALFLRAFTAYESDMEKLFLHYVAGGASLSGTVAKSHLSVTDEKHAKKLIYFGQKYLNWSKPQDMRAIAKNYIENGWPMNDVINTKSQELSECRYVRNHIAHNSLESLSSFNSVQRNLLQTERLFPITSGQLLRIRNKKFKKLHITHYFDAINDTLNAIIDPPP